MILNLNEPVAIKPDWISLQRKTLDGGYELGDVLETNESSAHFRVRVVGNSSIAAYASFYLAEGPAASEQLLIWQELRRIKHPNLKTPISSGRMKLGDVSTVYVICTMPDETLSEILADRGLTDDEGAELLKNLGQGLVYLHAHGFAHGALSPEMAVAVGDSIQISTECARRLNTLPRIEVTKSRYLAPEASVANVSIPADVWCLGATVFEALVQKKYETSWFGDLARLGPGQLLQHCLDTNPYTRARLSEIIGPPSSSPTPDAAAVPVDARVKPVTVSRKPIGTNRVRTLDASEMQLVKVSSGYEIERLKIRVKSTGASWRPMLAGAAALVLLGVVIWLVILPKFQSISDSSADETQTSQSALPARTVGEASSETSSAVSPAAAPHDTFRFVLGSYEYEPDADRRLQRLKKKHPDLDVSKLAKSRSGPFYVVAGGPMSEAEAKELREKALRMGISRASYILDFPK